MFAGIFVSENMTEIEKVCLSAPQLDELSFVIFHEENNHACGSQ